MDRYDWQALGIQLFVIAVPLFIVVYTGWSMHQHWQACGKIYNNFFARVLVCN